MFLNGAEDELNWVSVQVSSLHLAVLNPNIVQEHPAATFSVCHKKKKKLLHKNALKSCVFKAALTTC